MPIYTESKSVLIDPDTGEVLGVWDGPQVLTVRTKESYLQAAKHAKKDNVDVPAFNEPRKPSKKKRDYGDFLWMLFDTSRKIFPGIKPAMLSRLMMLSTYLSYDNELVDDRKRALSRSDIADILRVTYRTAIDTISELVQGGILIEKGSFFMNDELFWRGDLDDEEVKIMCENSKAIKRLYYNAVRALYNTASRGSIPKLSYIFRIMPFVNQEYNIVCFNPLEKNRLAVQPMSAGDLADIIGYGRTHSDRLQAMLLDPTFDTGNGLTKAVRYVSGDKLGVENHCLFINPEIYYGGSLHDEVAILGQFK